MPAATASTPDKRLTAARPDLADERLRGTVSAPRYAAGKPRRVRAPVAPLRRAPQADAPLDTEAPMGAAVTVFDEEEGWAWVQLADGYVGYMPSEDLASDALSPTHRVRAVRTFVFPGPNLKLPPLSHVGLGAEVCVVSADGKWARVATMPEGFVYADHLAPLEIRAGDFVTEAERLLGIPYLWGGRTSLGLDCSGLVQLSLALCGVAAPRDADMQERDLGAPIARTTLVRGDLVFWRSHVGIMQDATRLLHANAHHMAVASEPLAEAETRIEGAGGGSITSVRRLDSAPVLPVAG